MNGSLPGVAESLAAWSTQTRSAVSPGSREMQLLVACARARLRPADRAQIRELLAGPVRWDELARAATRHKLLPLMAAHLREFSDQIPTEAQTRFRKAELGNACRSLLLTGELLSLLRDFGDHDILAVPYKGPALGLRLYGALSLRQGGDIDIMVRRRDVERARERLLARGYRPDHSLPEGGTAFMMRSRYSETMSRPDGLSVELHWAFTNRDVALPITLDDLAPRLETILVGGQPLAVFGADDLLMILCVHGAKHRWERLEWICGVAEAVRYAADIDWDALTDRATRLGARRMLLLGLLLAHDMLDADVPPVPLRHARQDRVVVDLAAQVPAILGEPPGEPEALSLPMDLFRLRLRERRRDRVRFILYRLTTPSRPERWTLVPFAGRWIPVHALVRPFRLIAMAVPAVRWYLAAAHNGRADRKP